MTVRDNGVGVDPDQASRIFGMFSRAQRRHRGQRASAWRCAGASSRPTAGASGSRPARGRRQRLPLHPARRPVTAAEVVRRCRELAAVSEEDGAPHAALRDAGDGARQRARRRLDGGGGAGGARRRGRQPRRPARRAATRARGRCCSARTWTRCATPGAFDGPLGVLAAIACVERLRAEGTALPFAIDVLGFSDEEGAALRHRVPRQPRGGGQLRARAARPRDDDGVDAGRRAARLRRRAAATSAAPRGAASGCSATARSTSSRGRCSRAATRPSASSPRSRAPTRAEVELRGRAGHAGTVPMDARHDAACAAAEWVLAVEAAARAPSRAWWRPSAGWRRGPGAPNVDPGRGGRLARRPPRRRRGARGGGGGAARRGAADRRRARRRGRRGASVHERAGGGDADAALTARARRPRSPSAGCRWCTLASGAGHDAVALRAS